MSKFSLSTPVVLLIYNRPETTEKVFSTVRQQRPNKLLIVADGPKTDHPEDRIKCAAARKIIEDVDWDCDVAVNYAEKNMGLKRRISTGLDWVFNRVSRAIILEDDCLPDPSFFRFSEELLYQYKDDQRVMTISGNNFQMGRKRTKYSYYFSRYPHIWGWATWKRAWDMYEEKMKSWPLAKKEGWMRGWFENTSYHDYWVEKFEKTFQGKIDTWDYAWVFSSWIQNGLTILPNVNLVSNIGFGNHATHTKGRGIYSNMERDSITFPLRHPPYLVRNTKADMFTQKYHFGTGKPMDKISRAFQRITDYIW